MTSLLQGIVVYFFPIMRDYWDDFIKCINETITMTYQSFLGIFVIGLAIGVMLVVTRKSGLFSNIIVFQILDKIVNIFRSIPFIILIVALIPTTRLLTGTSIGVQGAIFPLIIGTTPFFARQMETSLLEVDNKLLEAALSLGASKLEIIFRVYLRESIPSIIRGVTITIINLIGLTAMAGAVGAGGLGDFAIRYGYQRNNPSITLCTIILLVIFISIIQALGSFLAKKTQR